MTRIPGAANTPTLEKLLESLRDFLLETLKDCCLPVRRESWEEQPLERMPEVHIMGMPEPDEEHARIPYILLQLLNGSDERDRDGQPVSRANVRMIVTIYNPKLHEGKLQILQLVQRIRNALLRAGVVGDSFRLDRLEYLIYPDETEWYHLGELSTEWVIPPVERDLTAVFEGDGW